MNFKNQLYSDLLKLKKTSFFMLHILVPLVGILVFFSYQLLTKHDGNYLLISFCQVLALIYPIIAAWVTTVVTDQEIEAGGGFFLLNAASRNLALLSKLCFLLVFGFLSCLLAVSGYHFLNVFFVATYFLPIVQIGQLLVVVVSCSIFQYFFHTWLGLRFGRNVNFSVAVVELLISALMLTGLGELIWFIFPSAWGLRMISLLMNMTKTDSLVHFFPLSWILAFIAVVTLLMIGLLFSWLKKWEGRKNEE